MIKEGVRNMNTVKKIICKVLIFLFIGTIIIISVSYTHLDVYKRQP